MVSWNDLQVFIARLNDIETNAGRLSDGMAYGLPTEAEWEYACRAGSSTAYSWSDDFNTTWANSTGSNIGETTDVGSYDPNAWGFFDMHGNVWEYCSDWYGTYPTGAVNNPTGPSNGSARIKRGGSFVKNGSFMRSASRGSEEKIIKMVGLDSVWPFTLRQSPITHRATSTSPALLHLMKIYRLASLSLSSMLLIRMVTP